MELSRNGNSIRTVEDWFEHARPLGGSSQWRDGYSAKELAKAWCRVPHGPEAPADFAALLNRLPGLPNVKPVSGEPEYRIRFDGLTSGPRNADLVLRCMSDAGTVAVSVEAKSRESFGRPVYEVMGEAAERWCDETASNYMARLEDLKQGLFGPRAPGAPRVGELRYQLLTATAGALTYAEQVAATAAVLVIHEFRPPNRSVDSYADNARDLLQFVHRLGGTPPAPNEDIWGPFRVPGNMTIPGGIPLFIAKLESPCDAVAPLPPRAPRRGRLPDPE